MQLSENNQRWGGNSNPASPRHPVVPAFSHIVNMETSAVESSLCWALDMLSQGHEGV